MFEVLYILIIITIIMPMIILKVIIISATSAFEFLEYFPKILMGNSDSIKHDNVATCSTCQ